MVLCDALSSAWYDEDPRLENRETWGTRFTSCEVTYPAGSLGVQSSSILRLKKGTSAELAEFGGSVARTVSLVRRASEILGLE